MHIRKLAANLVREELDSIASVRAGGVVGNAKGNAQGHGSVNDHGLGRHRDDKNLLSYLSTFNICRIFSSSSLDPNMRCPLYLIIYVN